MAKKQISEFFEDFILHVNELSGKWYLGNFYTIKRDESKEILDGQQRLTTIFILIKELLLYHENLKDEDAIDRFKSRAQTKLGSMVANRSDEGRLLLDEENKFSFNEYLKALVKRKQF